MSQPSSRRDALRAHQAAEQAKAKRMRTIVTAASAVVAVVIIAIVGIVVADSLRKDSVQAGAQVTPPHATADFGIDVFPGRAKADALHVVAIQDFQCPWCKVTSDNYTPLLDALAEKGEITLEYRTIAMLDAGLRNDASMRSAMANASAAVVGKYREYHEAVYAHQPQHEGDGFSDELLRDQIPAEIGLTGDDLSRFHELYDSKATKQFVEDATKKALEDGYTSTPTYLVNGTKISLMGQNGPNTELTEDALLAALKQVAGK